MANTLLLSNNSDEITSIISKKFAPRLKTDNDSIYYSTSNNNTNLDNNNQNNINSNITLNEMSFLFPSIPLEEIEDIIKNNKNKNIPIEEQLRQLTISESKKKQNKKDNQDKPNYNFTSKFGRKFPKNIPMKRNYNSLIGQSYQIHENPNANKNITYNNINNNNNNIINNNVNFQVNNNNEEEMLNRQRIEKERELQRQKETERMKERKKMELKTVDKVAQELLESRNQDELKDYLFGQLILLDEKKQDDNKKEQIKGTINQLNNDKIELRKCNTAVSRALNKRIVDDYNLDCRVKKIENEISKVKESIKYHALQGDLYKQQLNYIKENNYI